jgi:hypothetical protein
VDQGAWLGGGRRRLHHRTPGHDLPMGSWVLSPPIGSECGEDLVPFPHGIFLCALVFIRSAVAQSTQVQV